MIPLPLEFKQQIEQMLGDEAPAFFASMEEGAALALRRTPWRDADFILADYTDGNVPWEKYGHYLKNDVRPGAGIAHTAGAFYLQEASAMVSVAVLQPQPGERILDLCAAPGGKSSQIASYPLGEGLLISNEPEPSRAKVLASNLERLGVRNAAVVNAYPDALSKRWPEFFDAILCDAPCSGEGMFRRDPQSRTQWNPAAPAGCAKRQAEILDHAARMLRPGGRLVYSTCTFNPNENEQTISAFLSRHPEFHVEDFQLPGVGASEHGCIRIWPQRVRGDGHFAARLRKDGDCLPSVVSPYRSDKQIAQLIAQLEREICVLPDALKRRFIQQGEHIYAISPFCPDFKGIKLVTPGVQLLRVGKNYIEPDHALAMAIDPASARRAVELTDEQASRYLAGEALSLDLEKGWTLVLWRGLPLGWGKASNAQLKNHLPKGLRRTVSESSSYRAE